MRISDGSSDVCSSDLKGRVRLAIAKQAKPLHIDAGTGAAIANDAEIDLSLDEAGTVSAALRRGEAGLRADAKTGPATALSQGKTLTYRRDGKLQFGMAQASDIRSEEHTSELQSLMRTSYAVFCLKKKK